MIYLYLLEKRPFCFMNIHIHIINSVIPMGQIHTLYGLRYIKNITFSNMHMKIKAKYMIISCGKNLTYCVVLNTNFIRPAIQYLRSENMNIIIYNDITSLRVIKHWILENLSTIQVLLSVISDSALFSSVVQFWVPDRGHFPWAVETGSEHQSNGGIHDHPVYPPQNEKKRYSTT